MELYAAKVSLVSLVHMWYASSWKIQIFHNCAQNLHSKKYALQKWNII